MSRSWLPKVLLLVLLAAGCTGPTGEDIDNSIEAELRSVAGDWSGTTSGTNAVTLEFRLVEGSGGQVSGTGTMREANASSSVPITVTGTFARPTLTLAFGGMVYEGRSVQGSAQGSYTSVGGVSTTLNLTGTDYSRALTILLQER